MERIDALQLARWLRGDGELAILDVREQGVYARGHLLFASSVPLSTLELRVEQVVPRKTTKIVVVEDVTPEGPGRLATLAGERLGLLGYSNVCILAGGEPAWENAGFQVFGGIYVPSKAFGELVEHHRKTPNLGPAELMALLKSGRDVKIFDSRPIDEFRNMSIPGAVDCPGGELVYRVPDLVRSPDTIVVVNCAGRTRSIMGAQSLIDAGLPNPVFALRNGTMGWELEGFEVNRGKDDRAPEPSSEGEQRSRKMVSGLTDEPLHEVQWNGLQELLADQSRTTYLFDVRSPEEFSQGHIDEAVSAPGGQLIQATDSYMATLRSRVVLFDDKAVRDVVTARWLAMAGWRDVMLLRGVPKSALVASSENSSKPSAPPESEVKLDELKELLSSGKAHLVDVTSSADFLKGHIPGARFAIRSRLDRSIAKLENQKAQLVLTSPDAKLAHLARLEVRDHWHGAVKVLSGGTNAWRQAGRPIEHGFDPRVALDKPEDLWHTPSSYFGAGKSCWLIRRGRSK